MDSNNSWYFDSIRYYEDAIAKLEKENPDETCWDIREFEVDTEWSQCPQSHRMHVYDLLGNLSGLSCSVGCIATADLPAVEDALEGLLDSALSSRAPHVHPLRALRETLKAVRLARPDRSGPPPGPSCRCDCP